MGEKNKNVDVDNLSLDNTEYDFMFILLRSKIGRGNRRENFIFQEFLRSKLFLYIYSTLTMYSFS